MRAVIQRVLRARVEVGEATVGAIDAGLVCFLGVGRNDTPADVDYLVDRTVALRVFEDESGKMARSLVDTSGALLVVSQFTLCADTSRGRRPSFDDAMPPETAEPLYDRFVERARGSVRHVATGRFRAQMVVFVENDGPVTLILESKRASPGQGIRP